MIHVMAEQQERNYYSVTELAARWEVTERAVRKWIVQGAFPNAYKVGLGKGSHYRVPVDDVAAFENARKVRPS